MGVMASKPVSGRDSAGRAAVSLDKRSADRRNSLLLLAVGFAASVGISWHSGSQVEPVFSQPPAPPTTENIVGFPASVDVLANLERAAELTPRDQLVGIEAVGVSANGLVDVDSPNSRVTYHFQSAEGEGPEPPRAPGTLARKRYCGRQAVEITRRGIGAKGDQAALGCDSPLVVLPPPTCGPSELWLLAKSKGATDDQRATLTYDERDGSPTWHFQSASTQFTVGSDCKTEL